MIPSYTNHNPTRESKADNMECAESRLIACSATADNGFAY